MSIGDGVQSFLNSRHNSQLKSRLNVLTEELSTGRVHDLSSKLGADRSRYAGIERSLSLLSGHQLAAKEAQQTLAIMQTNLAMIDDIRVNLSGHLIPIAPTSSDVERAEAATAAKDAFQATVGMLNNRFADRSLFAGTSTDRAALASADDMLASLTTAVAGATDAASVSAAIDTWFSSPGGGFATTGYLGSTGDNIERRVDTNQSIEIAVRADDPAILSVLKATALAAVAGGLSTLPNSEASVLMRKSGEDLLTAGQGLVHVQSRLGAVEGRLEEIQSSQTAQSTALGLLRNDMVSADPFETASALQEVQIQLETHYTLTARLSRLSLTEYMR